MSVERILNSVQTRLNGGVLEDFARAELLDVAELFFERSCAWRETFDVTWAADTAQATVTLSANTRIVQLMYVGDSTQKVQLTAATVEGESSTSIAKFVEPNILLLQDGRAEEFAASAVCAMTATSLDAFPAELLVRWREGLTNGLLGRLYAIPQRPWTSEKLALWHTRLEKFSISQAQRLSARNFGSPGWRFPQFA